MDKLTNALIVKNSTSSLPHVLSLHIYNKGVSRTSKYILYENENETRKLRNRAATKTNNQSINERKNTENVTLRTPLNKLET